MSNRRKNILDEPEILYTNDFTHLIKFKYDYQYKPVISIMKDDKPRIILETFNEYYKEISEFLIAIGEPLLRTKNFHEYELNRFSLYSAASMNIKTEDIIIILENVSKNYLQDELKKYIRKYSEKYGKARLILNNGRYFINCKEENILDKLLAIQIVQYKHNICVKKRLTSQIQYNNNRNNMEIEENNIINNNINNNINNEIDNIPPRGENYIEIDISQPKDLEEIKKSCEEKGYPLLEEFDFKNDKNIDLKITPKFKAPIRSYQEKALNIMCNNGRARSGIIVLPCGSGKTLVGILAICTIHKNTIIICNNTVAVEQWYREIKDWVNINNKKEKKNIFYNNNESVVKLTSNRKKDEEIPLWNIKEEAGILITSFSMISYKGKRNEKVKNALEKLEKLEWGLMIIDEVQLLPAESFRTIAGEKFKVHCKLGLTATLVREDEKIKELIYLIGPKHYEANWLDLQKEGFLARVKCTEVWCEMDQDFYSNYLYYPARNSKERKALYISNSNKFLACLLLLEKHKGDQIIIFSDNLFTIERYNEFLKYLDPEYMKKVKEIKKKYTDEVRIKMEIQQLVSTLNYKKIDGNTNTNKREEALNEFKKENGINILLMTKVGDISIDIPNANVIIQVSSHFGSRMQEAQRFGRILRPKKDALSEYNAFFYTIVSKNTEEMKYSSKRHRFLVDQGYYFNVITKLEDIFDDKKIGEEEIEKKINYLNNSICKDYKEKTLKLIKESKIDKNDIEDEEDSMVYLAKKDEEDEYLFG